jgi:hypothetical protein
MRLAILLLLLATPEERTTADYLQFACWTHSSHRERIDRVLVTPRLNTPPMFAAAQTIRRTAPVLTYMRRVTFCSAHTLDGKFTQDEARQMYESATFLVDVSYHFDSLYGEDGW